MTRSATGKLRVYLVVAGLGLLAALALGRPELAALAAPFAVFVALGLALAHVPSGLEIDLGGALLFAATEHVSHAGVDRAFVVHVAWRPRERAAQ